MARKKPETLLITGNEIAEACGFKLDPLACKSCGGCGWFTSVGPKRPCECNPYRRSIDACFRDLEHRKHERNMASLNGRADSDG